MQHSIWRPALSSVCLVMKRYVCSLCMCRRPLLLRYDLPPHHQLVHALGRNPILGHHVAAVGAERGRLVRVSLKKDKKTGKGHMAAAARDTL